MNAYKRKIRKQKRRLFISVAASLFALSVIVSAVFTVVTFNTEKQLLYSDASSYASDLFAYLENLLVNERDYAEYYLNSTLSRDEQFILLDNDGVNVAQTKNTLPVNFQSYPYYEEEGIGCIDFDSFKSSMTAEQYKKITDYLLSDKSDDGSYYELLCREFYYYKGDIIPKSIEIVKTTEENVWYVQDEVVEHFKLEPVVIDGLTLYKNGDMQRNVIDKEFVFGNYSRENLFNRVRRNMNTNDENNIFTYVLSTDGDKIYYTTYGSGNDSRLVDDGNFSYLYAYYTSFSVRDDNGDVKIYSGTYVNRLNVLESCFNRIAFILIYIIVIFAIVGVILAAVIWHTMKKQLEQEEKLRITTNAMAHELKTPLFIIDGYAENLLENINTDKQEHYAQVILQKSNDVNCLIERMLDYSRLDSGYDTLHIEKANLTDLVKDILENYDSNRIDLEYDKEIFINADKRMIKSAIENLVDNAIKYSTNKNVIKITITPKKFTVSNPCKMLSESDIDKLWQPYHRLAEHSSAPGHGLGLAIVKRIFELHRFKYGASYEKERISFWFEY